MSACDKDVKEALTKIFNECDKDKSGFIDAKEVEAALKRCNQSPDCKNKWDDARIKQETAVSDEQMPYLYSSRLQFGSHLV